MNLLTVTLEEWYTIYIGLVIIQIAAARRFAARSDSG